MSSLVSLKTLDSSSHLDSLTSVIGAIVVFDLNVFQIVGPETQRASTGGFSIVAVQNFLALLISTLSENALLVTSVLNYQPNISFCGKGDGLGDMVWLGNIDRINGIIP